MQINYNQNTGARLEVIEGTTFKISYYAEITATSGQISPPQETTILLNQWANGVDALVCSIEGGKPTFEDSGIDVNTFDSSGNYVLSGSLPSSPSALIYYITVKLKYFSNLDIDYIIEFASLTSNSSFASAGVLYPHPSLVDNLDGTVNIASANVTLHENGNNSGDIIEYVIPSITNLALTDGVVNYVVADYNSGTPIYKNVTDVNLINESNVLPIYTVYRSGLNIKYIDWDSLGEGLANKLHERFVKTERFKYESGLILSESGTRNIDISAGKSWHGAVRTSHNAFASTTDQLVHWYPVAGVWNSSLTTQFTNNQYNDGVDLQTLTSGFYTNVNVYRTESNNENAGFVLGNSFKSLAEAENADLPDIPTNLTNLGIYVGRFIIKGNDVNSSSTISAFSSMVQGSAVTNHNNLGGLQGGSVNDYQHITSAEVTNFANTYTSFVDKHKNGFLLSEPLTNGDISFVEATRTFTIEPQTGQPSFDFYSDSVKYEITTAQSVVIPDTTGTHFIYFDENGLIQSTLTFYEGLILKEALVGLIYWNATAGEAIVIANERHGSDMAGVTHLSKHLTTGALYSSGMDIVGLVDNVGTFTQINSGLFFDEDIQHNTIVKTTQPFWYRDGASGDWFKTTPDNLIGYNGGAGNFFWNENTTGTTWQLTRSAGATDFIPYHVIATNDINNPYVKIIGQSAYPTRNAARAAIEDEIRKITLNGLPSPEFVFLYSYIVRLNGVLEDLADGSTYVDFRTSSGGSVGGTSPAITSHADLTNLDADDHLQYKNLQGRSQDAYTITSADSPYDAGSNMETVILADKSSGNIVINFPSCSGQWIDGYVKVVSTTPNLNTVTITLDGTDTIDGSSSDVIITSTNRALHFKSDGISNYNVLANKTVEFYRLELGKESVVGTAPTLYSNLGAGIQRSFSSTATNTITWNKNLPDDYNGESLLIWIGAQIYSTTPISTSAITLQATAVFEKADGTQDTYTTTGQVITEAINVSSYTASRTAIFTMPTAITGVQGARAVMFKFSRLGADTNDTYTNTFDIFGINLIKI